MAGLSRLRRCHQWIGAGRVVCNGDKWTPIDLVPKKTDAREVKVRRVKHVFNLAYIEARGKEGEQ